MISLHGKVGMRLFRSANQCWKRPIVISATKQSTISISRSKTNIWSSYGCIMLIMMRGMCCLINENMLMPFQGGCDIVIPPGRCPGLTSHWPFRPSLSPKSNLSCINTAISCGVQSVYYPTALDISICNAILRLKKLIFQN